MLVKDVMTREVKCISSDTSLEKAAKLMAQMDCGFLALTDDNQALQGVVTDRDIAIRAVAEGMSPKDTRVGAIKSEKAYSCMADDTIETAADTMRERCIY